VRIGTCSWADDALVKHWYPRDVPAPARLAWYAERFSTVEVDSTFYRVPTAEMVQRWAERTPDGFVMHVRRSASRPAIRCGSSSYHPTCATACR